MIKSRINNNSDGKKLIESAYIGSFEKCTEMLLGTAVKNAVQGLQCKIINFEKSFSLNYEKCHKNLTVEDFAINDEYVMGKSDILKYRKHTVKSVESIKHSSHHYDVILAAGLLSAHADSLITDDELFDICRASEKTAAFFVTGRTFPAVLEEYCRTLVNLDYKKLQELV